MDKDRLDNLDYVRSELRQLGSQLSSHADDLEKWKWILWLSIFSAAFIRLSVQLRTISIRFEDLASLQNRATIEAVPSLFKTIQETHKTTGEEKVRFQVASSSYKRSRRITVVCNLLLFILVVMAIIGLHDKPLRMVISLSATGIAAMITNILLRRLPTSRS